MTLRSLPAEILPVMVGMAGHVDHGKTALAMNLTGCVLDREPEAKKRGLTIDLGFAFCRLPGNRLAGLVDVPGHEDFIRNMTVGAALMDIVILVVAADDGIMPQTLEHLEIITTLGAPRLLVALTKTDLVSSERVEEVRQSVLALLASLELPAASVTAVSNHTGAGLSELRELLFSAINDSVIKPDQRSFRMFVERAFQVKGFGTVVTGVPGSGMAGEGDKLQLFPGGGTFVLRAVESYHQERERAVSRACTALCLRDLDLSNVKRGMILCAENSYQPTDSLIISLRADLPLNPNKAHTVLVHVGTAAISAKLRIFRISEGNSFVWLGLSEKLVILPGDRVVLRNFSPSALLGGGVVLAARQAFWQRKDEFLSLRLQLSREFAANSEYLLAQLAAGNDIFVTGRELQLYSGFSADIFNKQLDNYLKKGLLGWAGGDVYYLPERLLEALDRLKKVLTAKENADNGVTWQQTSKIFNLGDNKESAEYLAGLFAETGGFLLKNDRLYLNDANSAKGEAVDTASEKLLEIVRKAGLKAPALGDLAGLLTLADREFRQLLRQLVTAGRLEIVGGNVFSREALEKAEEIAFNIYKKSAIISLIDFRRETGLGRHLAVSLLDYFDLLGLSKREADGRVWLGRR